MCKDGEWETGLK